MTVDPRALGSRHTAGGRVSPEEWRTRVDLAACYRLVAYYDMTDLTFTHISARVPGDDGSFLLNPYWVMFEEITASSLVKLDGDGRVVGETPYDYNPAGYTIHSAVLAGRPDVSCVLHTHTRAGMAVAAQEGGLLPLTQTSLRFHDRLAYHDYEGAALDLDERPRLVRDLGDKGAMILRNHGLLTAGRTIPEAFVLMHRLESACRAQLDAQASGAPLSLISREVADHAARQGQATNRPAGEEWPSLLRLLDRLDPSYRT